MCAHDVYRPENRPTPQSGLVMIQSRWRPLVRGAGSPLTQELLSPTVSGSVGIAANYFVALSGTHGPPGKEVDAVLDETNAAVGQSDIHAPVMPAPRGVRDCHD